MRPICNLTTAEQLLILECLDYAREQVSHSLAHMDKDHPGSAVSPRFTAWLVSIAALKTRIKECQ